MEQLLLLVGFYMSQKLYDVSDAALELPNLVRGMAHCHSQHAQAVRKHSIKLQLWAADNGRPHVKGTLDGLGPHPFWFAVTWNTVI